MRLGRPYLSRGVPHNFRRYDLPFLNWLARTGREVDMLAQSDLESASSARALAAAYDLIVFPGHHEYVTAREYDLVEGYRNLGGNLLFLSANNFFWRVVRSGDNRHEDEAVAGSGPARSRPDRRPVPRQRQGAASPVDRACRSSRLVDLRRNRPARGLEPRARRRRDRPARSVVASRHPSARRDPERLRTRDDRADDATTRPTKARKSSQPAPSTSRG